MSRFRLLTLAVILPITSGFAADEANVEELPEFDALLDAAITREPWGDVSSDTRIYHSSNIRLLPDTFFFPVDSDIVIAQTFAARLQRRVAESLLAELFLHYQLNRYADADRFNYDTQSATLRLTGDISEWFQWYVGFGGQRQELTRNPEGEFFKSWNPHLGLRRDFPLHPRVTLFTGYQLDWQPSSPGVLDRVNNTLTAGLTIGLLDRLTAQVLYRLALQRYTNYRDRFDAGHTGNLTLFYVFCRNARIEAFLNYLGNESNIRTRDYDVFEAGGALRLSFNF